MNTRTIGDIITQLPTDAHQEFSQQEIALFESMSTKKKLPPRLHDDSDSDSDTDSDTESDSGSDSGSDSDSDTNIKSNHIKSHSVLSELKSTFLASLLFVLLSSDIITSSIQKMGIDGMKLTLVKLFLFATCYFILRYKFE